MQRRARENEVVRVRPDMMAVPYKKGNLTQTGAGLHQGAAEPGARPPGHVPRALQPLLPEVTVFSAALPVSRQRCLAQWRQQMTAGHRAEDHEASRQGATTRGRGRWGLVRSRSLISSTSDFHTQGTDESWLPPQNQAGWGCRGRGNRPGSVPGPYTAPAGGAPPGPCNDTNDDTWATGAR